MTTTPPRLDRATPHPLDQPILWALATLLLFSAAAFGVRHAWSELVFLTGTTLIVTLWLVRVCCPGAYLVRRHWVFLPVLLFLLVLMLQLTPLPVAMVKALSPGAVELRRTFLADQPQPDHMTLSLYPFATWHDLRLILAIAALFAVCYQTLRHSHQVQWLLWCVAAVGCLVSAVGLLQGAFGNDKVYWVLDFPGAAKAGPLVNYNHFGQFVLLTLGCTIGLFFYRLERARRLIFNARPTVRWVYLPKSEKRLIVFIAFIVLLQGLAVVHSGSRGAIVAMAVAGLGVALLATLHNSRMPWPTLLALAGIVLLGGAISFYFDYLYARFGSVDDAVSWRGQIALDLLHAFGDYPLFGMGQGTHRVAYPMYQNIQTTLLAAYADSDYPQLLAEVGLAGGVIFLAFIAILGWQIIQILRRIEQPISHAVYGLTFSALGVMIHSIGDFGQRRPANAMLTAIVFASILAIRRICAERRAELPATTAPVLRYGLAGGTALCLAVAVGILGPQALADARAEHHWQTADQLDGLVVAKPPGPLTLRRALLAQAKAAVALAPDNAEYRYKLNMLIWRDLSQSLGRLPSAQAAQPWVPVAQRMLEDLALVRRQCPTMGRAYHLEGLLRFAMGQPDRATTLLMQAYDLAPNEPRIAFVAAMILAQKMEWDRSLQVMARSLQIEQGYFRAACEVYAITYKRPDLAMRLAGDHDGRLASLASLFEGKAQFAHHAAQIQARQLKNLEARCRGPNPSANDLAALAAIKQSHHELVPAAQLYRSALNLSYKQVTWRLKLVDILIELEQIPQAIDEVKTILRIEPDNQAARVLLERLVVHPKAISTSSP